MKLKTKKIIAREGLIFLAVIILGVILGNIFPGSYCTDSSEGFMNTYCWSSYEVFSISKLFITVACYFVIRFIIWAIKTLKQKE